MTQEQNQALTDASNALKIYNDLAEKDSYDLNIDPKIIKIKNSIDKIITDNEKSQSPKTRKRRRTKAEMAEARGYTIDEKPKPIPIKSKPQVEFANGYRRGDLVVFNNSLDERSQGVIKYFFDKGHPIIAFPGRFHEFSGVAIYSETTQRVVFRRFSEIIKA